ncbi:MAG TPA: type III-A CRISPR-associated RAMP protein Csm5 [Syntrophales bacterium]|nr:type III-A CRISPR-associated RAMP protein Csm5 [Syntrophales bacterium]HOM08300.1 type III-A CRISPR-associated RAMP protein Csm5 [Syntrophales bacterium]HOO00937.1 type III-A CRISPR-associated RAMP protein Csm5 [Syntrophales bacterium]HPC02053.1 type III-A CRISPR-associated RAMP protein Csm5 [Syntrophales bacterium]
MSEITRFHIQVLRPVHVGCDDAYEPMGFIVDEERQLMRVFDPFDFIRSLGPEDKARFSAICAEGSVSSLLSIYKFMRGRQFPGREVALCSGFVAHYRDTLKMDGKDRKKVQQELNRFAVARTSYHPHTDLPYLPGSAVKGALRTAWLNELQRRKKIPPNRGHKGKDLEIELLDGGKFDTDPFRLVKVSDFMPVGPVRTRVVYALNEKKQPSKFSARGAYQVLEVIEPGAYFEGTIRVERPLAEGLIRSPIDAEELIAGVRRFYEGELLRESDELADIGIRGLKPSWADGAFPLRVGRHSGAESVTVAGHRRIRIMQAKGKPPKELDHATTLWLAAADRKRVGKDLLQFGWVLVTPGPAPVAETERERQAEKPAVPVSPPVSRPVETPPRAAAAPAAREEWQGAALRWNPGNNTLTAEFGGKKAEAKGRELVPPDLHKALFEKRRGAVADVTVEKRGNAYWIVAINK